MIAGDMTPEEIASLNRLAEIAFEVKSWIDVNAHNDYARQQMLRAAWYALYGEDLDYAE